MFPALVLGIQTQLRELITHTRPLVNCSADWPVFVRAFQGFFCVGRFRTVINEQVFNNRREGEHQRMKERGRELRMDISGQDADMINPRGQDLTG